MAASEEPGRYRANLESSVEVKTSSKSLEAVLSAMSTGISRSLPGHTEEELRWDKSNHQIFYKQGHRITTLL